MEMLLSMLTGFTSPINTLLVPSNSFSWTRQLTSTPPTKQLSVHYPCILTISSHIVHLPASYLPTIYTLPSILYLSLRSPLTLLFLPTYYHGPSTATFSLPTRVSHISLRTSFVLLRFQQHFAPDITLTLALSSYTCVFRHTPFVSRLNLPSFTPYPPFRVSAPPRTPNAQYLGS